MVGLISSYGRLDNHNRLEAVDSFASIRGLYHINRYRPRFVFTRTDSLEGQRLKSLISGRLSVRSVTPIERF